MRETLPLVTPGLQTSWFDPGTQVGSWYNSTNHHKENILGGHNLRQIRWICVDKLHCFKGDWLSVFDQQSPRGARAGCLVAWHPWWWAGPDFMGAKGTSHPGSAETKMNSVSYGPCSHGAACTLVSDFHAIKPAPETRQPISSTMQPSPSKTTKPTTAACMQQEGHTWPGSAPQPADPSTNHAPNSAARPT